MRPARLVAVLIMAALALAAALPATAEGPIVAGKSFERVVLPSPRVTAAGPELRQSNFTVMNASGHDELVMSAYVGADTSLEIFEVNDRREESKAVFSRRLPATRGAAAEGPFSLRIDLPSGSSRTYRAVASGSSSCSLSLWSARAFETYMARRHILLGFFYGAAFLVAAIQLAFSLALRDRSFLWYGLFVLISCVALSLWDGSSAEILGRTVTSNARLDYFILSELSMLATYLFLREVLALKAFDPRLDLAALVLAGASALIAVLGFLAPPSFYAQLVASAGGVNAAVLIVACVLALRKGHASAALVAAGLALQSVTALLLLVRAVIPTPPELGDFTVLVCYPSLLAGAACVSSAQVRRMRRIGAAREAAETRSRAMGAYLGDLSHELRAPVRLIQASVSELGKRITPSRELVALKRNLERLSHTIDLLVEPQDGGPGPRLPSADAVSDLAATVRGRLEAFAPAAAESGVAFDADLEPGLFVVVEPGPLERLVDGLLEEGLRTGPWGGRTRVETRRRGARAEIIAEFQAAAGEEGAGLKAARRVAEGLGGAFEEAPLGKRGKSVRIGLPVAPAIATGQSGTASPAQQAGMRAQRGRAPENWIRSGEGPQVPDGTRDRAATILVVVEDAVSREKVLGRLGREYRARAVPGPDAAIEELASMDGCEAFVAELPQAGPDILGLLRLARAEPRFSGLPFIVGLGEDDAKYRAGLLAEGRVAVLARPLDVEEVLAALKGFAKDKDGPAGPGDEDGRARLERVLGGLSHAIKNPLSGITGPLANLKRVLADPSPDKAAIAKYLAAMEESGTRIKDILRDVGTVLHAQPVKEESVLLEPILLGLGRRLEAAHDKLRIEIGQGGGRMVAGSALAAERLFENVLHNAVDAMSGAGLVEVGFRDLGERLEVSVRDHGPGIPPEILARVFEPFFTTKEEGEGMGLGLSIVRDLAREMGWEVELASTPGQGAEFRVRAPLRPGRTGAS